MNKLDCQTWASLFILGLPLSTMSTYEIISSKMLAVPLACSFSLSVKTVYSNFLDSARVKEDHRLCCLVMNDGRSKLFSHAFFVPLLSSEEISSSAQITPAKELPQFFQEKEASSTESDLQHVQGETSQGP